MAGSTHRHDQMTRPNLLSGGLGYRPAGGAGFPVIPAFVTFIAREG